MGLLHVLRDGASEEISRWVSVLDDDGPGRPECKFKVAYLSQDVADNIGRRVRQATSDRREQERSMRRMTLRACTRDWQGLTKTNLMRLCDYFLTHPDAVRDLPDEIPFDAEDLDSIAGSIGLVPYGRILEAAIALDEFVRERMEQEKKDSARSSASANVDSPQSPARA